MCFNSNQALLSFTLIKIETSKMAIIYDNFFEMPLINSVIDWTVWSWKNTPQKNQFFLHSD